MLKPRYGLLILAALGLFLRFHGLKDQGIFFYDEAYYLLQAKTNLLVGSWVLQKNDPKQQTPALKNYLSEQGGIWPDTTAKPLHIALVSLAYLLVRSDFSGLGLSALAGVLTIGVVWLIGKRLDGPLAGLWAAGFLSVSWIHLWYSRLALSTTECALFLSLAWWAYLKLSERPGWRWASLVGFLLGASFGCHYYVLPVMVFFPALEICRGLTSREGRPWFRNTTGMVLGFGATLLVWEILFRARNAMSPVPLLSYFQELHRQIFEYATTLGAQSTNSTDFLFYLWIFARNDPWWFALASLGAGAGLIAWFKTRSWETATAFLLGPGLLVFWSFAILKAAPVARSSVTVLPGLVVAAGLGFSRLTSSWRIGSSGLLAALVFCLLGIGQSVSRYPVVSGYRQTSAFLESRPAISRITTTAEMIFRFYWGGKKTVDGKVCDQDLASLPKPWFVVLDKQYFDEAASCPKKTIQKLYETRTPDRIFAHVLPSPLLYYNETSRGSGARSPRHPLDLELRVYEVPS